ncbi:uncharacterized protein LOC123201912 isoform X3 [Mangifera indica]|uniref:uncharacterized protein LOC123201912 isoform X3 n=1 Tax=Mangifera indica TaxID=29780 RepID=UPI001CFA19F2|nr:uncharacterized protein LOC123201912 isoform X3 [Mangifera indica]
MEIMSDKGEKTCPLCTEEMDLTDKQLKPCKCGYEICVWCWHHIMEMAEKDGTEGRCPACRTAYDKEKIVGMAAKCERMVAEINSERKLKLQRAKPKAAEGRMHLSNVRVIQRNLVYIIGLPLNLADEELLKGREYFGQYGKVLKVSISRTATGVIQHSSNNSCCVYITYTKEEEAIRCIQSAHGFILEGRPLRACFGTTKYCHAWLRNMPCSIPDCLYLHDFGSQEDSFTKDEIVSAFTRSRVQQIVGATNNMHRSGDVLPPPADDYINSSISLTAKPVATNSSNNIDSQNKGYCADNGTGKSNSLPAATSWVMRVSASLPPSKNLSGSGQPSVDQPKISNGPQVLKSDTLSTIRSHSVKSMEAEANCEVLDSKLNSLNLRREHINGGYQIDFSNTKAEVILGRTPATSTTKNRSPDLPSSNDSKAIFLEHNKSLSSPGSVENENHHIIKDSQGLCSGLSSICLQNRFKKEYSNPVVNGSSSSHAPDNMLESQGSQEDISEQSSEPTASPASNGAPVMEDFLDFDDQQLKGSEAIRHNTCLSSSPYSLQNLNQSSYRSWQSGEIDSYSNLDVHNGIAPMKYDTVSSPLTSKNEVSSFVSLDATVDHSRVFSEVGLGNYLENYDSKPHLRSSLASDVGEGSIISKILSIDSDSWEDSLTSPSSLVKLLSKNDQQYNSLKIPNLFKESESRQSRFSFARQDDLSDQISDFEPSVHEIRHSADKCHASNDLICTNEYRNIFSSGSSMESENIPSCYSFMSSSVSKAPTSAPPGFAVLSRAPPPGFSSHRTMNKTFDGSVSTSQLLQTSTQPVRISGRNGDVAFFDPAIMEVGQGSSGISNVGSEMRQTLSPEPNPFDLDARLQLLMRQSISEYPNLRFPNHLANKFDSTNNRFSPPNDTCSISPMLYDQSQPSNPSASVQSTAQHSRNAHMPSGHLGGWNEVKSISHLGVSDYMTNGGVGFNSFIPHYEDLKCQISNPSNFYSRGFAM